jgi:hypothetical protein
MYFQSENQRDQVLLKLSLLALYILLGYDAIVTIIGYIVSKSNIDMVGNTLVRNIVFVVAIADLVAIFLVKKSMLGNMLKIHKTNPDNNNPLAYNALLTITLVITAMCIAISTYGLVLIFLGEKLEVLLLFVAISLLGYQFFRLRPRDFEENYDLSES